MDKKIITIELQEKNLKQNQEKLDKINRNLERIVQSDQIKKAYRQEKARVAETRDNPFGNLREAQKRYDESVKSLQNTTEMILKKYKTSSKKFRGDNGEFDLTKLMDHIKAASKLNEQDRKKYLSDPNSYILEVAIPANARSLKNPQNAKIAQGWLDTISKSAKRTKKQREEFEKIKKQYDALERGNLGEKGYADKLKAQQDKRIKEIDNEIAELDKLVASRAALENERNLLEEKILADTKAVSSQKTGIAEAIKQNEQERKRLQKAQKNFYKELENVSVPTKNRVISLRRGEGIALPVYLNALDHSYHFRGPNAQKFKEAFGENFISATNLVGLVEGTDTKSDEIFLNHYKRLLGSEKDPAKKQELINEINKIENRKKNYAKKSNYGTVFHKIAEEIDSGKLKNTTRSVDNYILKKIEEEKNIADESQKTFTSLFIDKKGGFNKKSIDDMKKAIVEYYKQMSAMGLRDVSGTEMALASVMNVGGEARLVAGTLDQLFLAQKMLGDRKTSTMPKAGYGLQLNVLASLLGSAGIDVSRLGVFQTHRQTGKTRKIDYDKMDLDRLDQLLSLAFQIREEQDPERRLSLISKAQKTLGSGGMHSSYEVTKDGKALYNGLELNALVRYGGGKKDPQRAAATIKQIYDTLPEEGKRRLQAQLFSTKQYNKDGTSVETYDTFYRNGAQWEAIREAIGSPMSNFVGGKLNSEFDYRFFRNENGELVGGQTLGGLFSSEVLKSLRIAAKREGKDVSETSAFLELEKVLETSTQLGKQNNPELLDRVRRFVNTLMSRAEEFGVAESFQKIYENYGFDYSTELGDMNSISKEEKSRKDRERQKTSGEKARYLASGYNESIRALSNQVFVPLVKEMEEAAKNEPNVNVLEKYGDRLYAFFRALNDFQTDYREALKSFGVESELGEFNTPEQISNAALILDSVAELQQNAIKFIGSSNLSASDKEKLKNRFIGSIGLEKNEKNIADQVGYRLTRALGFGEYVDSVNEETRQKLNKLHGEKYTPEQYAAMALSSAGKSQYDLSKKFREEYQRDVMGGSMSLEDFLKNFAGNPLYRGDPEFSSLQNQLKVIIKSFPSLLQGGLTTVRDKYGNVTPKSGYSTGPIAEIIMKQLYRQDKDGHYVYNPTQQFSTFDKQGGKVAVLSGGRIDRQKTQWSSTDLERLGVLAIPDETEKAADIRRKELENTKRKLEETDQSLRALLNQKSLTDAQREQADSLTDEWLRLKSKADELEDSLKLAEKNPNNLPMTREDLEDNKDMRNLRVLIMKGFNKILGIKQEVDPVRFDEAYENFFSVKTKQDIQDIADNKGGNEDPKTQKVAQRLLTLLDQHYKLMHGGRTPEQQDALEKVTDYALDIAKINDEQIKEIESSEVAENNVQNTSEVKESANAVSQSLDNLAKSAQELSNVQEKQKKKYDSPVASKTSEQLKQESRGGSPTTVVQNTGGSGQPPKRRKGRKKSTASGNHVIIDGTVPLDDRDKRKKVYITTDSDGNVISEVYKGDNDKRFIDWSSVGGRDAFVKASRRRSQKRVLGDITGVFGEDVNKDVGYALAGGQLSASGKKAADAIMKQIFGDKYTPTANTKEGVRFVNSVFDGKIEINAPININGTSVKVSGGGGRGGGRAGSTSGSVASSPDRENLKIANAYLKNRKELLAVERQLYNAQQAHNVALTKRERESQKSVIGQLEVRRQELESVGESLRNDPNADASLLASIDTRHAQDTSIAKAQSQTRDHGARNIWELIGYDIQRSFSRVFDYGVAYRAINALQNSIRDLIQYTKELDKAMTNLRIVTGKNTEEANEMMRTYNGMAKTLGVTTQAVAESANEWLRQGYSVQEANELIEASVQLSKLGMIESSQATEYLTSVLKGFRMEAAEVSSVVDQLTALDLDFAVSSGDVADALSRTAAVARSAGLSLSETSAALTVIMDVTQTDSGSAGNAFKTILSRYGNVKAGAFESIMESDESMENINDTERVLSALGISIRNSKMEMRDFGDTLDELASKWVTYSSVEKNAIATAMAGTRQRNAFVTLMDNYESYQKAMDIANSAEGTAAAKYKAYTDSLEAAMNRLQAAWEGLAQKINQAPVFSWLANAAASLVEHLPTVLKLVTTLFASLNSFKIPVWFSQLRDFFRPTDKGGFWTSVATNRGQAIQAGSRRASYISSKNATSVKAKSFTELKSAEMVQAQGATNSYLSSILANVQNIAVKSGITPVGGPVGSAVGGAEEEVLNFSKYKRSKLRKLINGKQNPGGEFAGISNSEIQQRARNELNNRYVEFGQYRIADGSKFGKKFKYDPETGWVSKKGKKSATENEAAQLDAAKANRSQILKTAGVRAAGTGLAAGLSAAVTQEGDATDKVISGVVTGGLSAALSMIPGVGPLLAGVLGPLVGGWISDSILGWIHADEIAREERAKEAQENLDELQKIADDVTEANELATKERSEYTSEDYAKLQDTVASLESYSEKDAEFTEEFKQQLQNVGTDITNVSDALNQLKTGTAEATKVMNAYTAAYRIREAQLQYDSQEVTRYENLRKINALGADATLLYATTQEQNRVARERGYANWSDYVDAKDLATGGAWSGAIAAKSENEAMEDDLFEGMLSAAYASSGWETATQGSINTSELNTIIAEIAASLYKSDENNEFGVYDQNGNLNSEIYDQIYQMLQRDERMGRPLAGSSLSYGQLTSGINNTKRNALQNALGGNGVFGKLGITTYNDLIEAALGTGLDTLTSKEIGDLGFNSLTDLKNAIFALDPSNITDLAHALGLTESEAKNAADAISGLTTEEALKSADELVERFSTFASILGQISQDGEISAENVEKILSVAPYLMVGENGNFGKENILGNIVDMFSNPESSEIRYLLGNAVNEKANTDEALYSQFLSVIQNNSELWGGLSAEQQASLSGATTANEVLNIISGNEELKKLWTQDFVTEIADLDSWYQSFADAILDAEKKTYQQRIDNLQSIKDSLDDINETRQKELDLIKARDALENARNEKVRVYRAGIGWTYESDQTAVQEAKEKVDDLERQLDQDNLQFQIDQLQSQMDWLDAVAENESAKRIEEILEGWKKNIGDSTSYLQNIAEFFSPEAKNALLQKITGESFDQKIESKTEEQNNLMKKVQTSREKFVSAFQELQNKEPGTAEYETAYETAKAALGDYVSAVDTAKAAGATLENAPEGSNINTGFGSIGSGIKNESGQQISDFSDSGQLESAFESQYKKNRTFAVGLTDDRELWWENRGIDRYDRLYNSLSDTNRRRLYYEGEFDTSIPADVSRFFGSKKHRAWYITPNADGSYEGQEWQKIEGTIGGPGSDSRKVWDNANKDPQALFDFLLKHKPDQFKDYTLLYQTVNEDTIGFIKDGKLYQLTPMSEREGGIGGNLEIGETKEYAKGTLSAQGGLSLINEFGTEGIITPSGTLTSIPAKSGIVPAELTKNLSTLGEYAPNLIKELDSRFGVIQGERQNSVEDNSTNINNLYASFNVAEGFDYDEFLMEVRREVKTSKHNRA